MAHLIIKNIGPIKHVDIELKKINVLIGKQNSGKSVICKIASFCAWVEKTVSIGKEAELMGEKFKENLERFHYLYEYLNKNSEIIYTSDIISIKYESSEPTIELNRANRWNFKRPKIEYITADRYVVSECPDWNYPLLDNYLLSFMTNWNNVRTIYTQNNPLPILDLDVAYYYDKNKQTDFIRMKNGQTMELDIASDGLQSVIPLLALFTAYTERLQEVNQRNSFQDEVQIENTLKHVSENIFSKHTARKYPGTIEGSIRFRYDNIATPLFIPRKYLDNAKQTFDNFVKTQYANIFIEKPELKLCPATQRSLTYQLVKGTLNGNHKLFITTNSQYILYALNNCMMGYLVKDKIPATDREKVTCKDACVNPEDVSVWEITDGSMRSIKEEDGLIGGNYLDNIMQEIMDEFYVMLNYYGNDSDHDNDYDNDHDKSPSTSTIM